MSKEGKEKLQILLALGQTERVDGEVARLLPHVQIAAAEDLGERFKAPADVEDVRLWPVFLQVRDEEIEQETLARAGHAGNQAVSHFAIMQVEEIRRVVVRLHHCQVLRAQMCIRSLAWVNGEEE